MSSIHSWVQKLEAFNLKFYPMGEGSSYLKYGVYATAPQEVAAKVRRFCNGLGMKALLSGYAKVQGETAVRKDGVWLTDINLLSTPNAEPFPMIFISKPDTRSFITVILRMRSPLKPQITASTQINAATRLKASRLSDWADRWIESHLPKGSHDEGDGKAVEHAIARENLSEEQEEAIWQSFSKGPR